MCTGRPESADSNSVYPPSMVLSPSLELKKAPTTNHTLSFLGDPKEKTDTKTTHGCCLSAQEY
jgi:hypothetical protein